MISALAAVSTIDLAGGAHDFGKTGWHQRLTRWAEATRIASASAGRSLFFGIGGGNTYNSY